jgi:uncharacterized OsmC-like protein
MQATQNKTETTRQADMQAATIINGVNVTAMGETFKAVRQDPTLAHFQFRANNRWLGGGLNRTSVGSYHGTHMEHERPQPFVFTADEPPVLLGEDRAANPVEYLMHALAACVTTTMAYHAAGRGIEIESIESKLEGDIDLNGLFQTDPSVKPGFQQIRIMFKVKSDGDAELLRKLCQYSPVFDTISKPVDVKVQIEKM